jgi:hypothetical protein
MAVSKRLRFEILKRDNHACKYCGRTPPEVKLHIDHVVPVTLGGSDDPANLVAACSDCNGGKSSVPADAPLVADVAADALRWARAMELVAFGRSVEREERRERYRTFYTAWKDWYTTNWRGEKTYVDLPDTYERSIDQFIDAGLEMDDLLELIRVAMSVRTTDEWRYFCGCCWKRIREAQEHAAAIVSLPERDLPEEPFGG